MPVRKHLRLGLRGRPRPTGRRRSVRSGRSGLGRPLSEICPSGVACVPRWAEYPTRTGAFFPFLFSHFSFLFFFISSFFFFCEPEIHPHATGGKSPPTPPKVPKRLCGSSAAGTGTYICSLSGQRTYICMYVCMIGSLPRVSRDDRLPGGRNVPSSPADRRAHPSCCRTCRRAPRTAAEKTDHEDPQVGHLRADTLRRISRGGGGGGQSSLAAITPSLPSDGPREAVGLHPGQKKETGHITARGYRVHHRAGTDSPGAGEGGEEDPIE